MVGSHPQDLADPYETWFVVIDYTTVGRDGDFTIGKSVECVNGFIGRDIGTQVDQDFNIFGGIVVDSLDFNLALFAGLDDGVNEAYSVLPIGKISDNQRLVIHLLNLGPDPDGTSTCTIIVTRHFGQSTCWKIRK